MGINKNIKLNSIGNSSSQESMKNSHYLAARKQLNRSL